MKGAGNSFSFDPSTGWIVRLSFHPEKQQKDPNIPKQWFMFFGLGWEIHIRDILLIAISFGDLSDFATRNHLYRIHAYIPFLSIMYYVALLHYHQFAWKTSLCERIGYQSWTDRVAMLHSARPLVQKWRSSSTAAVCISQATAVRCESLCKHSLRSNLGSLVTFKLDLAFGEGKKALSDEILQTFKTYMMNRYEWIQY